MPPSLRRIWITNELLAACVGKKTNFEKFLQLGADERRPLHGIPILIKVIVLHLMFTKQTLIHIG